MTVHVSSISLSDISPIYKGIITKAFSTVKAKSFKLFHVCEVHLILHVYCWQQYLVCVWWVSLVIVHCAEFSSDKRCSQYVHVRLQTEIPVYGLLSSSAGLSGRLSVVRLKDSNVKITAVHSA
jgi:hypothetical protein